LLVHIGASYYVAAVVIELMTGPAYYMKGLKLMPTPTTSPISAGTYIPKSAGNTFGSTVVVIIVLLAVFAGAYLTSKYFSNKARGFTKSRYMRVLDSMFVGKDKNIVLVETSNKLYMLGVTAQSVNLIEAIDKEMAAPLEADAKETAQAGGKGFVAKMGAWLGGMIAAPSELKKAHEKAKYDANGAVYEEEYKIDPDSEDDIEKMLHYINRKKARRTKITDEENGNR
jgi:flagellar protein FliO/FliZ